MSTIAIIYAINVAFHLFSIMYLMSIGNGTAAMFAGFAACGWFSALAMALQREVDKGTKGP
jgi:hypothetical protein